MTKFVTDHDTASKQSCDPADHSETAQNAHAAPDPPSVSGRNKFRVLDAAVLALYATAVLVVVAHHEPWSDEAQSWVLARDLPLSKLLFHEMHYEVSPGLWQSMLWVAQHVFHLPYASIGWIGAAFAIAGAALLIFAAPFPRPVRYLMAFSYDIAYQYAVVARPYGLLLLFAGAAAIFYRRRKTIPLAISLSFLSAVSLHGIILAGAIAAGAAWEQVVGWKTFDRAERRRSLAALAIVAAAMVIAIAIASPARDTIAINGVRGGNIHKLARTLGDIAANPWWVGVALLLFLGVLAAWRRQVVVFTLGVGTLLVFQSFFYGAPHHQGAIVIAIIVSMWISYPDRAVRTPSWFRPSATGVLAGIFFIQVVSAIHALRYDYAAPYSGAADAARFLQWIGPQRSQTSGFGWNAVALQPYFDHNIFVNWPTAYVHHSIDAEPPISKLTEAGLTGYLVIPSVDGDADPLAAQLAAYGYVPLHVSPGRILDRHGIWVTETFTIYQRVRQQHP